MVNNANKLLIIEFTGPAGSGKSSISKVLRESYSFKIKQLNPNKNQIIWGKIKAILITIIFGLRYRLSLSSYKALWNTVQKVESRMACKKGLNSGMYFFDEGPLSKIATRKIKTLKEYKIIHAYLNSLIKKLEKSKAKIIVCKIIADEQSCFYRRKQRMYNKDKGRLVQKASSLNDYKRLKSLKGDCLGIDYNFIDIARLKLKDSFIMFEVNNSSGRLLEDVANEIILRLDQL